MNRFQKTAARIQAEHGVSVVYDTERHAYVVEDEAIIWPCRSARFARRVAAEKAAEFAARCGAGNSYRRRG